MFSEDARALLIKIMDRGAVFIVMGISGCGKTSMARRFAEAFNGEWLDADDFHSVENRIKMSAGVPLTDDDRWPWLDRLNTELRRVAGRRPIFLACSALKQKYRDRLTVGLPHARFVYLKGSMELIRSRLVHRQSHFMPVQLLASQFSELEEPKDAIVLDISKTEDEMLNEFVGIVGG